MKKPSINLVFLIFILIFAIFLVALISFNFQKPNYSSRNDISHLDSVQDIELNNTITEPSVLSKEQSNRTIIAKSIVPKDTSITISAIGDIMCHNTQFKDAKNSDSYDFSYVFSDVEHFIKNADIAIGNLETTFAGSNKPYQGYPNFNSPESMANDLAELGLDVITTSNNHSLDTGYSGLESTLNFLDEANLSHVGTARSIEEQNTILIKEINNLKLAFLSYTYGTNGIPIPKGKEYCINLIDKDLILSQLQNAKAQNPDLILVSIHWGSEYELTPNANQTQLADFLFENGADIILGSHPHVLQPLECRKINLPDGTTKNGFVIYSLGNFMSGQTQENTRSSIILNLKLTKNGATGLFSIDEIIYTPIYTYTSPKYKNYKILDLQKSIYNHENKIDNSLSINDYNILKKELEKINSIYLP